MSLALDTLYMQRCFQLARLGAGNVAPNPMVGAVLVYENRIIGEGYHQQFGGPHAEVHCLQSVPHHERHLISQSTLYVSLEPCSHYGKTPPCATLIVEHQIPHVVIGCTDSFESVNGKGIAVLEQAGIEVTLSSLRAEALELNKRFFTYHQKKRPYIVLKWAQTREGIMGSGNQDRLLISHSLTNILVHRWRSEEAAIVIGAKTALLDNPMLDNRHWFGKPPLKVIVAPSGKIPMELNFLKGEGPTWIYNKFEDAQLTNLQKIKISSPDFILGMLENLYQRGIQSVLVEGGQQLLQSFIEANLWDEARIITNLSNPVHTGLGAPKLTHHQLIGKEMIQEDEIRYFKNTNNPFLI